MIYIEECEFYRDPSSLHIGLGVGYCDIDCINTICDGDIRFCERKETVRKALVRARQRRCDARISDEETDPGSVHSCEAPCDSLQDSVCRIRRGQRRDASRLRQPAMARRSVMTR
jgi:hypothetical protein